MDRRSFIKASAGAALGGAYLLGQGCAPNANRNRNTHLSHIGIQLYTVRSVMQQDFEGTLAQLAEIGYDEVEFAGYYDRPPQEIRTLLDDLGIRAPATHVSIDEVRGNLDRYLEIAGTVGHDYVIVPYLSPDQRQTVDSYRRVAEDLNAAGERSRQAGVKMGYHNHEFEFEPIDGQIPYDILIEETDPDLVAMELDIYWTYDAGQDPFAYFERYPGRFELCHVKDRSEEGTQVDVGQGTIDFPAIFARSEQAGLQHYFVEHDNPPDPMAFAQHSYNHLNDLRRQEG